MSLFGSLFSGVTGLTAQSQAMSMISDNVANVNTVAYKRASAQFSTLVTGSVATSAFTPGGVRPHTSYNIGSQGLIQSSASPTHVAISGNGFFVVNAEADGGGEELYTRAGAFEPDVLGNLRTGSGFFLQGWALDDAEQIVDLNTPETVNVRGVTGTARATAAIGLGVNLDAGQADHAGAYAAGDMAAYGASGGTGGVAPHFNRAVQVYDPLGAAHNLTLAFLKSPTANEWHVEVYAEPGEVDAASHPDGLLASGTVSFNGNGTLAATALTPVYPAGAAAGGPLGVDWVNGADDGSIALDLGAAGTAAGLRQFDADFDVSFVNQDGVEVGALNGVSIDGDGYVTATFTNGQSRKLYKLPIGTFANPLALDPRTGNAYARTTGSGAVNLHHAGAGSAGSITPSSLEAGNVDLADEFTKMIVTQRAYSANARVITTADQMLDELMRVGR
ncbi:MAG TPA: flagellar hook protein FlgE [Geminicoccaceae bacterium]|nr:flagellar hook protein FlgE [Geminicoccaceae bacterium]